MLQTLDFQFLDKKNQNFTNTRIIKKEKKAPKAYKKENKKEESNVKHFPPNLRSIVNVYTKQFDYDNDWRQRQRDQDQY